MKYLTLAVLLMSVITGSINAQNKKTINELIGAIGEAFKAKTLRSLDAEKNHFGKITIVIQPSLGGKSVTKTFKSFEKVDEWLQSREKDELPHREVFTLNTCQKGTCTFIQNNLLHNTLYLKKVTYGYSKGRYYIKTITLLDGN